MFITYDSRFYPVTGHGWVVTIWQLVRWQMALCITSTICCTRQMHSPPHVRAVVAVGERRRCTKPLPPVISYATAGECLCVFGGKPAITKVLGLGLEPSRWWTFAMADQNVYVKQMNIVGIFSLVLRLVPVHFAEFRSAKFQFAELQITKILLLTLTLGNLGFRKVKFGKMEDHYNLRNSAIKETSLGPQVQLIAGSLVRNCTPFWRLGLVSGLGLATPIVRIN